MSNGIISSRDVTKVFLHTVGTGGDKKKTVCRSSSDMQVMERHCSSGRTLLTFSVDSFTDCLTEEDLRLAVKGGRVQSLHFLLTRNELDPFNEGIRELAQLRFYKCSYTWPDRHCPDSHQMHSQKAIRCTAKRPSDAQPKGVTLRLHDCSCLIHLLSDSCVDPSANHNYAIKIAASMGYSEVIHILNKAYTMRVPLYTRGIVHVVTQTSLQKLY
ncbi:hypothetical protein PROFUN_05907 [Planoprotostelium fungivorum]|uniref:Uncharacterized protein n=1 Tax=Planoprotostelium fungivorum TaxID=1890364 RepID=A0A2P6N7J9_9EUKA|nr:hypothetical protein PROFUN_05907 [Planoprotostelium fungivorum]